MTGSFALGSKEKSVVFFLISCHLTHSDLKAGFLLVFLDVDTLAITFKS